LRKVVATSVDTLLAASLAYLGFRLGQSLSPCPNPANCFAQIPLGIAGALLPIAGYFALGQRFWGETPGEHAVRRARISTR
jgi:hypothetical protein